MWASWSLVRCSSYGTGASFALIRERGPLLPLARSADREACGSVSSITQFDLLWIVCMYIALLDVRFLLLHSPCLSAFSLAFSTSILQRFCKRGLEDRSPPPASLHAPCRRPTSRSDRLASDRNILSLHRLTRLQYTRFAGLRRRRRACFTTPASLWSLQWKPSRRS